MLGKRSISFFLYCCSILFFSFSAQAAEVGRVYTMTNDAAGNEIVMFSRAEDGMLSLLGNVATGGKGTSDGLGNQSGIAISADNQWLITVNAGSNSVSVFAVTDSGLQLRDDQFTYGQRPTSVALSGRTLYVLNAGSDALMGFFLSPNGKLRVMPGSRRDLSGTGVGGAQIGFSPDGRTLVVSEKASNLLTSYKVGFGGYLSRGHSIAATGATPFGFGFGRRGQLFVTQAEGGAADISTVGAYHIDSWSKIDAIGGAVSTHQTAACWLVVSLDNTYAYSTNPGSNSISGFRIAPDGNLMLLDTDGVTAQLPAGSGPLDLSLTDNGKFLYTLNSANGTISGYALNADGSLTELGIFNGLPVGSNGLVAR